MNNYQHLAKLATDLDQSGFLTEGTAVDDTLQKVLLKAEGTDFTSYVMEPADYPASTASDEVAELLGQGASIVNNHNGANNYISFILPNFIERLDWLSRKYKDQITESDKASLGKLERDLHQIATTLNAQAPA